jgi:hypothetical protein
MRVVAAIVLVAFLAATHWKAYFMGGSEARAELANYKAQAATETLKLLERRDEKTIALASEKEKIRREKNGQIAKLDSDLSAALERLRERPERPERTGEGSLPSNTGTAAGASCTGAQLYWSDAVFLEREAHRAERLRLDLAECQAAYDSARKALK